MSAAALPATPPAPASVPAAVAAPANDYLFGRRRTVQTFSLLCLLMVFDFADRMILAALIPSIKAEWHITDATAGMLSSILTLGMVLCAFPASIAIERWSRVKTASIMGVVWSLASAAGGLASSATQLAASRVLVGAGEAGYAPVSYTWISAAFPKRRRQLALGLFSSAQPIGMALGVALGGYVATHYGWRHALGVMALPGLLIALWLYRGQDYQTVSVREIAGKSPAEPALRGRLAVIAGTPSLVFAYLSAAMGTLQWVPAVFFLPTYLNRFHDIPVQQASFMTSGVMLLSIVGVPLGGWVMDHYNRRNEVAKLLFPIVASLAATIMLGSAFGIVHGLAWQYGLVIAGAFVVSAAGTGPLAMTQELVHPAFRPFSATCAVVTLHLLGSVPGPVLAGLLSNHFGLNDALLYLVLAGGALQLTTLLLALRYYRRDLRNVAQHQLQPL